MFPERFSNHECKTMLDLRLLLFLLQMLSRLILLSMSSSTDVAKNVFRNHFEGIFKQNAQEISKKLPLGRVGHRSRKDFSCSTACANVIQNRKWHYSRRLNHVKKYLKRYYKWGAGPPDHVGAKQLCENVSFLLASISKRCFLVYRSMAWTNGIQNTKWHPVP